MRVCVCMHTRVRVCACACMRVCVVMPVIKPGEEISVGSFPEPPGAAHRLRGSRFSTRDDEQHPAGASGNRPGKGSQCNTFVVLLTTDFFTQKDPNKSEIHQKDPL